MAITKTWTINTAIAANTAKTSNATHTGDVTGSTSLTIANDAVTNAKIAANAVGTTEIADETVTLAKLEHGTSSNDGKFLRANNGADPTFETISIPSSFVTGMIIMWNSTVASIPSGWVLCDGNNSTPDLRDKFIVGAKQDDSGTAKTNVSGSLTQTGGATTDTVSISVTVSGTTGNNANGVGRAGYIATPNANLFSHSHAFSGSGSGSDTVNTLPPYYALCFIMKS